MATEIELYIDYKKETGLNALNESLNETKGFSKWVKEKLLNLINNGK